MRLGYELLIAKTCRWTDSKSGSLVLLSRALVAALHG